MISDSSVLQLYEGSGRQGREEGKAWIPKHFFASPLLFQGIFFYLHEFLWQIDQISNSLTPETLLKPPVIISVALKIGREGSYP